MFDTSEFEDFGGHSPVHFPKTDINFYNLSHNFSALEPWNKTTYKQKHQNHSEAQTQKTLKSRHLSFDSYQITTKSEKAKKKDIKHQVTLSTLTFCLQSSVNNILTHRSAPKRKSVSYQISRNRNSVLLPETSQEIAEIGKFVNNEGCVVNRGFTTSLRHTNLLKRKQEHQSKVKDIINRKDVINRKDLITNRVNYPAIKFAKLERQNESSMSRELSQIVSRTNLEIESRQTGYELFRKPKKASFVGIQKILQMNSEKQQ